MSSLCVSLDQVSALRSIRKTREPDPSQAAVIAELAGANSVSVQYRRDRRHIRDRDLFVMREITKNGLVIESAPIEEHIERLLEVKPTMVTFTADHADFDTPMSGIDFSSAPIDISNLVTQFHGSSILVSVLIDPELESVKGAVKSGVDSVLLDSNFYSNAENIKDAQAELDRIDSAAQYASKHNLNVRVGGGLNLNNITPLRELKLIDEFVVGHSIIAKSMLLGLSEAIKEMKQAISSYSIQE